MGDRVALFLALALTAFVVGDLLLTEGDTLLFLFRQFLRLLDEVIFWR